MLGSFLLATLNPGKKSRKGRLKRRRKLSAWQRAVKRHGGVMAAVKALRKRKRHKIKHNAIKRRAAVSRGSLRSRPRKHTRRVTMKVRRHRARRGARRLRARRNSWFGQPLRHRRAAKKGLARRRRRRHSRKAHSYTPFGLHGKAARKYAANPRRHRRRRYRRNAVVPVSWNPRRRRRYRRNAVLPYYAMNPAGVVEGVMGKAKQFINVDFWTKTALPAAGGFVGTKFVGGFVYGGVKSLLGASVTDPNIDKVVRIGSDVASVSVLSWAVGKFIGRDMGEKVFLGGVVAIAHSVLQTVLGGTDIGRAIGLSGFGSDMADRMKDAVARRVQAELSGMGTYLNMTQLQPQRLNGVGEFVTDSALRIQHNYGASPGGDLRDYDVTRSETTF